MGALALVQTTIELQEGALAALCEDPVRLVRELRIAAAVKWYAMIRLSQDMVAEISGVSRSEFIEALGRCGVSPFQLHG
jgi:hypothetical protein